MTLAEAVLATLLRLPVCARDRGDPRKAEQLTTVAIAITGAALEARDPATRAAELIAVGYHESRFCLDIHLGRHGLGNALTPWQIEYAAHPWATVSVGLDVPHTYLAAATAGRILDHSWHCGPTPAERFSAYAGTCSTTWKSRQARADTFVWAWLRLRHASL
jgi:hypothetical protein